MYSVYCYVLYSVYCYVLYILCILLCAVLLCAVLCILLCAVLCILLCAVLCILLCAVLCILLCAVLCLLYVKGMRDCMVQMQASLAHVNISIQQIASDMACLKEQLRKPSLKRKKVCTEFSYQSMLFMHCLYYILYSVPSFTLASLTKERGRERDPKICRQAC